MRAQRDDTSLYCCMLFLLLLCTRCQVRYVTGGRNNQNPRWTQKIYIHLCLQAIFGSDYSVCFPIIVQ